MDLTPLLLSLKIAGIATLIVSVIGITAARLIARSSFLGKRVLESILMLPLVLPPTVVGFGLLYLFGRNGPIGKLLLNWFDVQIVFTWTGAVIAAAVVAFPLMYQSAAASFSNYDRNIENAALTMGASKWRVFGRYHSRLHGPDCWQARINICACTGRVWSNIDGGRLYSRSN